MRILGRCACQLYFACYVWPYPCQVLNVAWAMHEIVSDHNRQTLQWVLHGGHAKPEL